MGFFRLGGVILGVPMAALLPKTYLEKLLWGVPWRGCVMFAFVAMFFCSVTVLMGGTFGAFRPPWLGNILDVLSSFAE